jgi:hypothetical protein
MIEILFVFLKYKFDCFHNIMHVCVQNTIVYTYSQLPIPISHIKEINIS